MNCFYSFPVALVSLQFPVFSLTAQMKHCNSTVSECNSTHCRTNSVQDSWSTSNQLWQADEFEIQAHCQAKQYCRMSARSSNPATGKKKLQKGVVVQTCVEAPQGSTETFSSTLGSYETSSWDFVLQYSKCVCACDCCVQGVQTKRNNKVDAFPRVLKVCGALSWRHWKKKKEPSLNCMRELGGPVHFVRMSSR